MLNSSTGVLLAESASLQDGWGRWSLSQSPNSRSHVDGRETSEIDPLWKGDIMKEISGVEGRLGFGLTLRLPVINIKRLLPSEVDVFVCLLTGIGHNSHR